MYLKILGVLAALTFVTQIGVSIYYSAKIVDQNFLVNKLESKYQQISLQNQQLENQLASLTSLQTVTKNPLVKSLVPITDSVKLQ